MLSVSRGRGGDPDRDGSRQRTQRRLPPERIQAPGEQGPVPGDTGRKRSAKVGRTRAYTKTPKEEANMKNRKPFPSAAYAEPASFFPAELVR